MLYKKKIDEFVGTAKEFRKLEHERDIKLRKVNEKIRSSYIKFLSPDATHAWLFKRLSSAILDLNNKYFNFDITGLLEGIQYTNYKTGEGHYQRHVD